MTPETLFASNIMFLLLALGLYAQIIILGKAIVTGLDRITAELRKMNIREELEEDVEAVVEK